ncbi:hypothetical protein R3P38DRAFT_2910767 [Favolaschia claudopus]|uniref:Uncharacterized protein n=1 Tax=Favolaschia claudopus TaxID=2862362 RepID=A0AAW0C8Z4_9AGAR
MESLSGLPQHQDNTCISQRRNTGCLARILHINCYCLSFVVASFALPIPFHAVTTIHTNTLQRRIFSIRSRLAFYPNLLRKGIPYLVRLSLLALHKPRSEIPFQNGIVVSLPLSALWTVLDKDSSFAFHQASNAGYCVLFICSSYPAPVLAIHVPSCFYVM